MALSPDLVEVALAVMAGLVAGFISGLFGVGGGVVAVPAAMAISGAGFHDAKAASLMVIVFGSTMGLYRHHQGGKVRWRHGLELAAGGVLGSILSSVLAEDVTETALGRAFGVLLVLVALRMFFKDPDPHGRTPHPVLLPILGFLAGLLTGFFGVGGGVIMVPGMALLGFPIHNAVATSLVAVVTNGAVAAGTQALLGRGEAMLLIGVPLAIGAVLGGRLGAGVALGSHAAGLKRAFAIFLALVGARFLL